MKSKLINKLFLTGFSLLALFASCKNQNVNVENTKENLVYVSVKSIDGTEIPAGSRTIFPDTASSNLTDLVLTGGLKNQAQTELKKWQSVKDAESDAISLSQGTWNFTLSAVNSGIKYSGSISNKVIGEESVYLNFELSVSDIDFSLFKGTGAIDSGIEFNSDSGVSSVKASLEYFNSSTSSYIKDSGFTEKILSITSVDVNTKKASLKKENLNAGQYKVTYNLYTSSSSLIASKSDFIYVAENQTTVSKTTAGYLPSVYTLNFDTNGGTLNGSVSVQYTRNSIPQIPDSEKISKTNCTFEGWFMESDFTGPAVTSISTSEIDDITLYAKWKGKDLTISYNMNGGEFKDSYPQTFNYLNETVLTRPVRTDYAFRGWYKNPDFSGKRVARIKAASENDDITLYAKWEKLTRVHMIYNYELSEFMSRNPSADTFTHLCMAFVSNVCSVKGDETTASTDIAYRSHSLSETKSYVKQFRSKYPNTKLLISFAGGDDGSHACSYIVVDDDKRKLVVENIISMVKELNVDGVDMDWEYFGSYGTYNPVYSKFVEELRIALDENFDDYKLLTIASQKNNAFYSDLSSGIQKMLRVFDFVGLMTYDFGSSYRAEVSENKTDKTITLGTNKVPHISFNGRHIVSKSSAAKIKDEGTAEVIEHFASITGADKIVAGLPYYGHVYYILPSGVKVPVPSNIKDSYSSKGNGYFANVDDIVDNDSASQVEGLETVHPAQGVAVSSSEWPNKSAAAGTTYSYKNMCKDMATATSAGYTVTKGHFASQDNCVAYAYFKSGAKYNYKGTSYDLYELCIYDDAVAIENKLEAYLGDKKILGAMAWVFESDSTDFELQNAVKTSVDKYSTYDEQEWTYSEPVSTSTKILKVSSVEDAVWGQNDRYQFKLAGGSLNSIKSGDLVSFKVKHDSNTKGGTSYVMRDGALSSKLSTTNTALSGEWDGWYEASATMTSDSTGIGYKVDLNGVSYTKDAVNPVLTAYFSEFKINGEAVDIEEITASKMYTVEVNAVVTDK